MSVALGSCVFKSPLSSSNVCKQRNTISSNGSCKFCTIKNFSRVSMHFYFLEVDRFSPRSLKTQRTSLSTSDGDAFNVSDVQGSFADHDSLKGQSESQQAKTLTSNELMKRLRQYGISGILSYGLLNTVYYLSAFLIVWFYVAPVPGRMGYATAVERFFKVMAMVWAGSQVTKLARAGGALALAPFVDRGLKWFTKKFKFESQGRAFMTLVGICFGLALVLFFTVTLVWA